MGKRNTYDSLIVTIHCLNWSSNGKEKSFKPIQIEFLI